MVEEVSQADVVVLHVVRPVVVDLGAEIVGLVQARVQALVQRVMLIPFEAQTHRVVHGVVQAVEAVVQPVVPEVVGEMTDLDVPAEGRARARPVAQRVEEPVFGARVVAQLLGSEAHVVALGFVGPVPESMVVLTVFRIVHSHELDRPPVAPGCPGLQRH